MTRVAEAVTTGERFYYCQSYCGLDSNGQNPLYPFPRSFPVDREATGKLV